MHVEDEFFLSDKKKKEKIEKIRKSRERKAKKRRKKLRTTREKINESQGKLQGKRICHHKCKQRNFGRVKTVREVLRVATEQEADEFGNILDKVQRARNTGLSREDTNHTNNTNTTHTHTKEIIVLFPAGDLILAP